MAGVGWLDPGEASALWSTEVEPPADGEDVFHVGAVHEFFLLISGHLELVYEDGTRLVGAGGTLYLPPGHRFRVVNTRLRAGPDRVRGNSPSGMIAPHPGVDPR
jgi:mannose-6-phosphate isomerase-like protein (cupin superfamily)